MTSFILSLKDCTKKSLTIYNSIVIENFKPMPLYLIKWRPFEILVKLHKSLLLIGNIVKGPVSDLRQFLTTESP